MLTHTRDRPGTALDRPDRPHPGRTPVARAPRLARDGSAAAPAPSAPMTWPLDDVVRIADLPPYSTFVRHIHIADPCPPRPEDPPVHVPRFVFFDGSPVGHRLPTASLVVEVCPGRDTRVALLAYMDDVQILPVQHEGGTMRRVLLLGRDVLTPPFAEYDLERELEAARAMQVRSDGDTVAVKVIMQVEQVTIGAMPTAAGTPRRKGEVLTSLLP